MTSHIQRFIQRRNPFVASREADRRLRKALRSNPSKLSYFLRRGVVAADGSAPNGEAYLYDNFQPRTRAGDWRIGKGAPGLLSVAAHRGSKRVQQDWAGATRFRVGEHSATALVVADGVSASGPLAARASKAAVDTFLQTLQRSLRRAPRNEARRHPFIERAMVKASFAANFEMVRQVAFDRFNDGQFDQGDRSSLEKRTGVDLPTGPLTPLEMMSVDKILDDEVARLLEEGRSAYATFATAVAVDNDLYTFTSGDAVVSIYRPSEPEGKRVIQLTHRDQTVVELFKELGDSYKKNRDVWQSEITECFGDAVTLSGTVRRYPNLLEPGDVLIVSSDGLGARTKKRGVNRARMEKIIESSTGDSMATNLTRNQVLDVKPGEYQDNVSVATMTVVDRKTAKKLTRGPLWQRVGPKRVTRRRRPVP